MDYFPKVINPYFYKAGKAQPLTLKEVLQLRDGMELSRNPSADFSRKDFPLPIVENNSFLLSLN